jgi:hypothetical protein
MLMPDAGATTVVAPHRMPEGRGRGDLDGDGVPDCWRLRYDGGSGYGYDEVEVQRGCAGRGAQIRLGGSFGSFCDIAALPDSLPAAVVDGLVDRWFGPGVRRPLSTVDGSLAWLIEQYQSPAAGDAPRRYTPRWQPGAPAPPPIQAVILQSSDEQDLARRLGRALIVEGEAKVSGRALLVYNAHNHGAVKEAARAGGLTVYLTNHALAVRDDARGVWSWAYVGTDQRKLRFPTTKSAATDGKLVAVERWVQQEGSAHSLRELVVIDPRAGRYLVQPLRAGQRWSLDDNAFARRLQAASPTSPAPPVSLSWGGQARRRMRQVYADPENYTSVYVDDSGHHYLYSLCSNVGWFDFCMRMNASEVDEFSRSRELASKLSFAVCRNTKSYQSRFESESFVKGHSLTFEHSADAE